MSLIKNSINTLSSSIVSQTIGMIIFFIIPNVLSVDDYAVVVFTNVLIFYAVYADIGVLSVYGRKVPGMLAQGKNKEVEHIEDSIQLFFLCCSLLYAIISGFILFFQYKSILDAILLIPIIMLTQMIFFYTKVLTTRGRFEEYRKLTISQSLFRLLIIAGSYLQSLTGWLVGSLTSLVGIFFFRENNKIYQINYKANPFEYISFIPEGLILGLINMVWMTLLTSGRLFATMVYPNDIVAQYGIVNSGYQMLCTAIISICVPMSIKILSLCSLQKIDMLAFITKTQFVLLSIFSIGAIFLADISPLMFSLLFKKYVFDQKLIAFQLLSIISIPFLSTIGSAFIGNKMTKRYLSILVSIFLLSLGFLYGGITYFGELTAAITQFVFLLITALAMLIVLWFSFIKRTFQSFLTIFSPFVLIIVIFVLKMCLDIVFKFILNNWTFSWALSDLFLFIILTVSVLYLKKNMWILSCFDNWFRKHINEKI